MSCATSTARPTAFIFIGFESSISFRHAIVHSCNPDLFFLFILRILIAGKRVSMRLSLPRQTHACHL